ncbi:MAG: type II toxin-antitoxin system PemK/MazF family toxin [Mobilicoccus sp.]|nr:type II toxin-antitoxin system PemK/MazF family toxin [Mobilicoccus sp.]
MNLSGILRAVGRTVVRELQRESATRQRTGPRRQQDPRPRTGHHRRPSTPSYPGDYTGRLHAEYRPTADGRPDPGEVCWAWVPYEEDHSRGKDRPVLVVGQDGPWLLGLPLTSKDHDRDMAQEARAGRHWMDVGTGGWDRQGRPSEVRLDRVVRLSPATVRREGAALDRDVFDRVTAAAARLR